jgi:hypothetical protein
MATITPDYQLAAGHNNAGGLTAIDSITDANGVKLAMPQGLPYRVRGERRTRLNSTVGFIGRDATQWRFAAMTLAQYSLMITTYEGLVTVRLALTSTSFANYNATLTMPDEADLEYGYLTGSRYDAGFTGPGYRRVFAAITALEAL